MSFSGDVKEELAKKIPTSRHCQLAEIAAIFHFCGQIGQLGPDEIMLGFQTERDSVVRKGFTLFKKTFNIECGVGLSIGQVQDFLAKVGEPQDWISPLLLKNSCCQRAYLRGVFLAVGSISDPQKGYHMEFVCQGAEAAEQLLEILQNFDIAAKTVVRRGSFVVYLKEGESISLLLNVMEAPLSLMELENTRIYKEMNNSINRQMNCEMSNIRKTVSASSKQVEDITLIRDVYGLERLPETLQQMAMVRLEYPEVPLKELGEYLDPPVGKSGVNHRLRRLCEIADKLREEASARGQE